MGKEINIKFDVTNDLPKFAARIPTYLVAKPSPIEDAKVGVFGQHDVTPTITHIKTEHITSVSLEDLKGVLEYLQIFLSRLKYFEGDYSKSIISNLMKTKEGRGVLLEQVKNSKNSFRGKQRQEYFNILETMIKQLEVK